MADVTARSALLAGWGRTARTRAEVRRGDTVEALRRSVLEAGERGVVARGLGRSYGDAAQNAGGTVLHMTGLRRVHSVDAEAGLVDADAGVSIDALMRVLLPFGLWIPVIPGTRQVTLGGAVAADVHGKNHHVAGSFGSHVRSMELLTADGQVRRLQPDGDTRALFWATVGGMGLTGVVVRMTLAVQPVSTAYFTVDTERATDIDDLMARLSVGDADYPYSVAWFDALSSGGRLGRAVITRGRSARVDELPAKLQAAPLSFDAPKLGTVPPVVPNGLLNRTTGRLFNSMWFHKAPRLRRGEVQNITKFFHPLDIVAEWNRLYGPAGFCQYQFVVPVGEEEVFRRCVEAISASGHVSFLNVLKRFGEGNASPMSFPMAGWTLAVDMPVRPGLDRLFAELDELVLTAGGRVYLAKDSRLRPDRLASMYPRLEEFRAVRTSVDPDNVFRSDLARRLDL